MKVPKSFYSPWMLDTAIDSPVFWDSDGKNPFVKIGQSGKITGLAENSCAIVKIDLFKI